MAFAKLHSKWMAEAPAKAKAGHGSRRGFSRLLGGRGEEEEEGRSK